MKVIRFFFSVLLLLVGGLGLWFLWEKSSMDLETVNQSHMYLLLAAQIISITLNRYAHRVGHLIGGLVSGYRLVTIDSLYFRYHRTSAKRVTRIPHEVGIIPTCLMAPKNPTKERVPFVMYVSGGMLIHLLLAIGCYFIGISLSNPIRLAFLLSSANSLIFFVIAAIPVNYADGRLLLELVLNKVSRRSYHNHLLIRTMLEEGATYQETTKKLEDLPSVQSGSSYLEEFVQLTQVRSNLEQRLFENASAVFYELPSKSLHKSERIGEEIFFDAIYGRLIDSTTKWQQNTLRLVHRNHPLWLKRIRTAVELFASHDLVKARTSITTESAVSNGAWSKAEIDKERNLLNWMNEYIQVSGKEKEQ